MKKTMDEHAGLYKQRLSYRADASPNQCLAQPWFVRLKKEVYYPRYGCSIEPLICGEQVFARISEDMKAAKKCVDIITWGFDPGMVLVRGATAEAGQRYGDLLIEIATRKENPVMVRLLVWHDDAVSQKIMNNAPGYYGPDLPQIGSGVEHYSEQHQAYSADWYEKVVNQAIPNITLHVRHVDVALLERSLADETLPEGLGVAGKVAVRYAAHHQKMVLIDFENPPTAVGYVMGHNSMTEYWDTAAHTFRDTRRERIYHMEHSELMRRAWSQGPSFEGAPPGYSPPDYLVKEKERAVQAYIEANSHIAIPYQDVSCRLKGPILHDLNHNFCQGWNESERPSSLFLDTLWMVPFKAALTLRKVVKAAQARLVNEHGEGFIASRKKIKIGAFLLKNGTHAVQLVRTQPLHAEKGVKECYANLTRQMGHYIFIQNQYLQYAAWAEHLLECVGKLRAAGYTNPIYVFLLTSTPERAGMDRPTYEVTGKIGQSETMTVEHSEAVAKAAKVRGQRPITEEEMSSCGINVVMGSLWTYASSGLPLLPSDYEEIYIHSKVAIADDAAFTIGSTNLNLRSMAVDSELNVLCNASDVAFALRCALFQQCAGGQGPVLFGDMSKTFEKWKDMMDDNLQLQFAGEPLVGQLKKFLVRRIPGSPLI